MSLFLWYYICMMLRKLIFTILLCTIFSTQVFAYSYINSKPEHLTEHQTSEYKKLNETLDLIFFKLKSNIKTNKYPKYFHDYTLEKDDGTHNKTYNYVKMNNVELVYKIDTNELKYISFRRPELGKCRILYDYPSGNLHAIQVFSSDSNVFIYGPDGKYVDYEPYIKNVKEKVLQNWKMPSRKRIEAFEKNKKDLAVQIALTINKDGTIKKMIILKSAKINALDDNAYDAIKSAEPFDKFPDNFFNEEITVTLNFNFSL